MEPEVLSQGAYVSRYHFLLDLSLPFFLLIRHPAAARFWRTAGPSSFVSSHFVTTTEHMLAIWALTNTRSLDSANPNLDLRAVVVETQSYHFATIPAVQKKGFHPLGESLNEPVEKLDSGDFRVVSATYSSGRLWATLASQMLDTAGTATNRGRLLRIQSKH